MIWTAAVQLEQTSYVDLIGLLAVEYDVASLRKTLTREDLYADVHSDVRPSPAWRYSPVCGPDFHGSCADGLIDPVHTPKFDRHGVQ